MKDPKPLFEILDIAAGSDDAGHCNGECEKSRVGPDGRSKKHTVMVMRVIGGYTFRFCPECLGRFCQEVGAKLKIGGPTFDRREISVLMFALGVRTTQARQKDKSDRADELIKEVINEQTIREIAFKLAEYSDRISGT